MAKQYSSSQEYMAALDELLKRNKASQLKVAEDTGMNAYTIPGTKVRNAIGLQGAPAAANQSQQPQINAIQPYTSNAQPLRESQQPQPQYNQGGQGSDETETYQESIDRALRTQPAVPDTEGFNAYLQEKGINVDQQIPEQYYIDYFLNSRNITDPTSRSIISTLLLTPTPTENKQAVQGAITDVQKAPLETMSGNISNFAQDMIGDNPIDPTSQQYKTDVLSPIKERLRSLAMSGNTNVSQEEIDNMKSLYGPSKTVEQQQAEKEQQISGLNKLGSQYNLPKGGAVPTNTPQQDIAYKKLLGQTQDQGTNPLRQFAGNVIDVVGTTLGAGEGNLSERVAGGPTINTGKKIQNKVGDFKPQDTFNSMGNIFKKTVDTVSKPFNEFSLVKPVYSAERGEKIPQQEPSVVDTALAKAGEGIKGLQSGLTSVLDEGTNIFKKMLPTKSKMVGDDGSSGDIAANPVMSKTQTANDIRDQFFKAGGAETYKDYLNTGVTGDYRGALDTNVFKSSFYEDPNRVAHVFGQTGQAAPATEKYRSYVNEKYPIVPGHDKPTVMKTARGKYEDGSDWSIDYEDVDPVYYENQYNQEMRASVPSVLTSDYKWQAPKSTSKSNVVPAAPTSSVKSQFVAPQAKATPVPAAKSYSNPFAAAAGTSVYSTPQKSSTPASSGYSVPTKSYSAPASSGYKAPTQSKPSAPQQSAPRPAPAPTPAPRQSAPAPQQQSRPQQSSSNAWSAPKQTYAAPKQQTQSKPAQQSKPSNVFQNVVNTIKSWFNW